MLQVLNDAQQISMLIDFAAAIYATWAHISLHDSWQYDYLSLSACICDFWWREALFSRTVSAKSFIDSKGKKELEDIHSGRPYMIHDNITISVYLPAFVISGGVQLRLVSLLALSLS